MRSGNFADPAVDNILITAKSGALDLTAANAAATDAAARLTDVPGVAAVGEPVPARDGSALLLPITMSGDPETGEDRVQPLLDATASVQAGDPQLRVEEVGGPSISKALDDTLGEDFQRAELLSLPVTLAILTFLVMTLTFRSVVVALTSIVLNLLSVGASRRSARST